MILVPTLDLLLPRSQMDDFNGTSRDEQGLLSKRLDIGVSCSRESGEIGTDIQGQGKDGVGRHLDWEQEWPKF